MSHATIYDVAERAGVSIATVSRVLNTPHQVNETTRLRVLAAIDTLRFVPRADATARARKGMGRIGVLAPFFTYPSFVQRLRGISASLAGLPHDLVIYNVDSAARRDAYLASLPVSRRLDGLIIMALPFGEEAAHRLMNHKLETVLVECGDDFFSSVEIDDYRGGQMAAEYLLSHGHRRFGFIGDSDVPDYAIPTSEQRMRGYLETLADSGFDLVPAYVRTAPHGLENARLQAHSLFELPDPPTAIFTPSDTQAIGVLRAARERGLRIPDDLAVIGFDDMETSAYIGLTTIRQPLEESGRAAWELLLQRLNNPGRPVQHLRLPLTLICRETA